MGRTYHPDLAKALGFTHTKTPCASTLHYCFKDIDALEETLNEWASGVLEVLPDKIDKDAVAMDGKTLCGSAKQDAHIYCLLSATNLAYPSHNAPYLKKQTKSLSQHRYSKRLMWQEKSPLQTHF